MHLRACTWRTTRAQAPRRARQSPRATAHVAQLSLHAASLPPPPLWSRRRVHLCCPAPAHRCVARAPPPPPQLTHPAALLPRFGRPPMRCATPPPLPPAAHAPDCPASAAHRCAAQQRRRRPPQLTHPTDTLQLPTDALRNTAAAAPRPQLTHESLIVKRAVRNYDVKDMRPELFRTLPALRQTMEHLGEVMDWTPDVHPAAAPLTVQAFLWDRYREVRGRGACARRRRLPGGPAAFSGQQTRRGKGCGASARAEPCCAPGWLSCFLRQADGRGAERPAAAGVCVHGLWCCEAARAVLRVPCVLRRAGRCARSSRRSASTRARTRCRWWWRGTRRFAASCSSAATSRWRRSTSPHTSTRSR